MEEKWVEDDEIIKKIVNDIHLNKYKIILHNDKNGKNKRFRKEWNKSPETIKKLISFIDTDDYLYSLESDDPDISADILHVFKHTYMLANVFSQSEDVKVYIKIGIYTNEQLNNLIVVSFHEDDIL